MNKFFIENPYLEGQLDLKADDFEANDVSQLFALFTKTKKILVHQTAKWQNNIFGRLQHDGRWTEKR